MLILLTLLEILITLLNLLKKITTYKNFTWARAQVFQVNPTPMTVLCCSGTQPMVLVSFVTLWPKIFDTSPLFLRDNFDAKMLRKWNPGKPNRLNIHAKPYYLYIMYSRTQRTLLFLENVRIFPGNTTKFINSSDLVYWVKST